MLKPGDEHYRAYVGRPEYYDVLAAWQFSLLIFLGLREQHCLLDLGCGSLRAGRLLIPYLEAERYFGIEPNRWLIEEAIEREVGHDLIRIKKPRFSHNADFDLAVFGVRFDYILAQSIFSHTGLTQLRCCLDSASQALKADGLLVATFVEGTQDKAREGWVYPDLNLFTWKTLQAVCEKAGLVCRKLDWPHPLQTWFIAAKSSERLEGAVAGRLEFIPDEIVLTGYRYHETRIGRLPSFYYRGTRSQT